MKVLFMPLVHSIVLGELSYFSADFGFYFLLIGNIAIHIIKAGGFTLVLRIIDGLMFRVKLTCFFFSLSAVWRTLAGIFVLHRTTFLTLVCRFEEWGR